MATHAFCAVPQVAEIQPVSQGKLIFKQFLVNQGSVYNDMSGEYVAKENGLYSFTFSVGKSKQGTDGKFDDAKNVMSFIKCPPWEQFLV